LTDLGEELCRFVLQLELFGLQTELNEEDYPLYDANFASRRPGEPRRLITLVDILRSMKAELGVAQVADDLEENCVLRKEYRWANSLIRFRDKRSQEMVRKPDFALR
jgi:hypothetical protein